MSTDVLKNYIKDTNSLTSNLWCMYCCYPNFADKTKHLGGISYQSSGLRLCGSNAGVKGLIPGQGIQDPIRHEAKKG